MFRVIGSFGPIEWIAFLFSLLVVVKLVFVLFAKRVWYEKVTSKVYKNKSVFGVLFLVLALVVFCYLVKSISIINIMAVMAFTGLFIGLAFLSFGQDMSSMIKKMSSKKFSLWMMIYILIWLALAVWTLWELLI